MANTVKIKIARTGTFLEAKRKGEFNGKLQHISIKDIIIVPGLQYNLLSDRKLELKDTEVIV